MRAGPSWAQGHYSPTDDRLLDHETLVAFLDTLAVLAGFHQRLPCGLPDGRRPDILRVNIRHGALFIGDAKNTETPHNTATQARLAGYFEWLIAHEHSGRGSAMFAICTHDRAVQEWLRLIQMLASDVGLICYGQGIEYFDRDMVVVQAHVITSR